MILLESSIPSPDIKTTTHNNTLRGKHGSSLWAHSLVANHQGLERKKTQRAAAHSLQPRCLSKTNQFTNSMTLTCSGGSRWGSKHRWAKLGRSHWHHWLHIVYKHIYMFIRNINIYGIITYIHICFGIDSKRSQGLLPHQQSQDMWQSSCTDGNPSAMPQPQWRPNDYKQKFLSSSVAIAIIFLPIKMACASTPSLAFRAFASTN